MAATATLKALLKLDDKQYKSGMSSATKSTHAFRQSLAQVGTAIAATFSVGVILRFARSLTQLGSKISDLAYQSGLTTDQFQALEVAAIRAGVAPEKIRASLARLNISVGEAKRGLKSYLDWFKAVGISANDLDRMSIGEIFERVAKAASGAERGSTALSSAMQILGSRSAIQLREVLDQIANRGLQDMIDQSKKAGQIIDENLIKKMDKLEDRMQLLSRQSKVWGMSFADNFMIGAQGLFLFFQNLGNPKATKQAWGQMLQRHNQSTAQPDNGAPTQSVQETIDSIDWTGNIKQGTDIVEDTQWQEIKDRQNKKYQKRRAQQQKRDEIEENFARAFEAIMDKPYNSRGSGAQSDSMSQVGGLVGGTRPGLGAVDKQRKQAEETVNRLKELVLLDQERNRRLAKIDENTDEVGI